jgi:hypothetical protein
MDKRNGRVAWSFDTARILGSIAVQQLAAAYVIGGTRLDRDDEHALAIARLGDPL